MGLMKTPPIALTIEHGRSLSTPFAWLSYGQAALAGTVVALNSFVHTAYGPAIAATNPPGPARLVDSGRASYAARVVAGAYFNVASIACHASSALWASNTFGSDTLPPAPSNAAVVSAALTATAPSAISASLHGLSAPASSQTSVKLVPSSVDRPSVPHPVPLGRQRLPDKTSTAAPMQDSKSGIVRAQQPTPANPEVITTFSLPIAAARSGLLSPATGAAANPAAWPPAVAKAVEQFTDKSIALVES
mmetsp:Transcript_12924/g.16064  ORF Transcript_12924/g.16064 Transcript_12924/m.16064 type:complete len:248 (+) Transcript_12924:1017-1760(+)